MDRSTEGAHDAAARRTVVVQDLPGRGGTTLKIYVVGTLNGQVVRDAKVQKSVPVDGATSVTDGYRQDSTD